MSCHSDIFCAWPDCQDRWFGWERLKGPTHIKARHMNFFRCLNCGRVFVQNKNTRRLITIIDYYKQYRFSPRNKSHLN